MFLIKGLRLKELYNSARLVSCNNERSFKEAGRETKHQAFPRGGETRKE